MRSDYRNLAVLTEEEYRFLLAMARACIEIAEPEQYHRPQRQTNTQAAADRPGDDRTSLWAVSIVRQNSV